MVFEFRQHCSPHRTQYVLNDIVDNPQAVKDIIMHTYFWYYIGFLLMMT